VVIAALVTALVGGSAAWITWAKETPSDKSVERIVDTALAEHVANDPYRADAKVLEYRLAQNTEELGKVKEGMDDLKRDVGEIMGVLKALSKQLDDVSDHLKENDG
jgi:hypothetical protein